jgi:alkanesulfonate monooxygenase SsuD/methylene tetrahydromethanopterin reductase-like flavin-dependent oxidoreductase (luciferase family)
VRVGQLEDTLEIFKRLWTEPGKASYQGKYYHIKDAWCEPKPNPAIPVLVGGGGNTTMKLAAKYADWWNLPDANYAAYAPKVAALRELCTSVGRDPKTLKISWFGRLSVAKTEAAALAYSNGRWTKDNAFVGTVAQVIEQMRPFVELGVEYFMVEVLGLPDDDVVGMVREQLLPALQK